ncbi:MULTISPECIES: type I restriction enzyme HsdR N-terminal domain-containing protein [unclassified Leeuwenhoekiella]|uniref:type I restriction enzyme HsdR N-terminal domain-containing protein n=1 Tax=unclassified Leeuwenhoekiella TaxID=2615029 RepID=UPI000C5A555E|nr:MULTISPECIES: type I restriction enzyme HsdR N-terminal domain-containing protein [unclassified Leeuwenhoekiella]MAW94019.1 restriction endonuclease subunit R [Leeuwenhoekiella sp.]MBA80942.1 restriction endonuclease subunit R [Leeuwenhoekiella sp.]|tara:strand:- start:1726 stop:2172 length:447 start_codon:yes stop_codon:yes gene_type:complete
MQQLNFPPYTFRLKSSENKPLIFDPIRKKFVVLTPEEWVRQHTVKHLQEAYNYPLSLINVEKELKVNGLSKRYDVVVFESDGSIRLIVECKAPKVIINQVTFDQIARYNLTLQASFLMVTNGLNHYFCQMDYEQKKYNFLPDIPVYSP